MLIKGIKKIYYNTAKRKLAKKWSLLNIFYKTKKNTLILNSPKKSNYIFIYFLKKNLYNKFFKYLKNLLINYISKKKFIIKFFYYKFYKNIIKKNKFKFIFFNYIFFNYFISSFVYIFFIILFLFRNYVNEEKESFNKLLNKNLFSINIFYSLLKNYYIKFLHYNKNWKYLIASLSFDMKKSINFYYIFNLKALLSLNSYMLLFIEELKYDNDKYYKNPIDWKKIRKASFNHLNLNILKKNCISFFSFCIFELYMCMQIDKFFCNYLNLKFFDYIIDIEREFPSTNSNNEKPIIIDYYNNDYTFFSLNDFNLRIQYTLFIGWFHYIVFFKKMRYYLYIRNHVYFYNNFSKKINFLGYNNPTSLNKTKMGMNKYSKIKNEHYFGSLFITLKEFNDGYSFYHALRHKHLLKFIEKENNEENIFKYQFFKNFDINFISSYFLNKNFRTSFKIFWVKFLQKFYTTDNTINCYKLLMQVKSTYKFRQANYSYSEIPEMVKQIFVLPNEIMQYFNFKNKKITGSIFSNFFRKNFIGFYFFRDFFNYKNSLYLYKNLNLFKYMHKLSNLSLYYFNSNNFFRILNRNKLPSKLLLDYKLNNQKKLYKQNLLRKLNFNFILYNLKMYYVEKKNKKFKLNILDFFFLLKLYFNEWKSYRMVSNLFFSEKNNKNLITILDNINLRLYYLLWNYNTGFYSTRVNNYDNHNLLYGLNVLEFIKRTRILNLLNKFNIIFKKVSNSYKITKFLPLLKTFYFQLLYEDKEYVLLFFFLLKKENKIFINNSKKFLEYKNLFLNNFLYRHYTTLMLFDSRYYDDLFMGFENFKKNHFDKKLTPFIYRDYYLNYEDSSFYSLGIKNKFIFNKDNIII